MLAYSCSKGSIRLIDLRQSALCDSHSKLFEAQEAPGSRSFFTEIIASISDTKFGKDGRYILGRDYMTLKVGDAGKDHACCDDGVKADEDIISQLVLMGFNYLHCQKAAINTSNAGVEAATNWLFDHMDDPDIDEPIIKEQKISLHVDQSKLDTLVSLGIEEEVARKALQETVKYYYPTKFRDTL